MNITGSDTVLVQVKNRSRKTSFTKSLTLENPDLSSAEWVAEAPSACNGYRCVALPLAEILGPFSSARSLRSETASAAL